MPIAHAAHADGTKRQLHCPQCQQAMDAVALEGHYSQSVQTDLCGHCNLLWFDELESVNLSGLGWVQLLRRMQEALAEPVGPLVEALDCPRCSTPLRAVNNQSRIGHFAELECSRCRGSLASFSLLLAQRGVVRALSRKDLDTLQSEQRQPACLNCGAGLTREQSAKPADSSANCPYCRSPLLVIDMPRFLTQLLSRHAEALNLETVERIGWSCRGCGTPIEPTHSAACESCGHWVVVPSLIDLRAVLDAAEPLLRAARPRGPNAHGHRLRERRGDVRETALYRYLLRVRGWLTDGW